MDSLFEQAGNTAGTQLKKIRWAIGIDGVLSVAFGVVVLLWPGISLYALTILVGAWFVATGVVTLIAAVSGMSGDARGWAVLRSLLDIVVGVIVFVWPSISALALLYVIGAYAIILGIITIGGAFWLPFSGGDSALLVLTGVASIVFGIVMFAMPGDGALVLLALIAAFALVSGISELVVAIGGQRLLEKRVQKAFAPPRAQTSS
jgi:uncharacterized membrane protein HdeD (DUF308 family)